MRATTKHLGIWMDHAHANIIPLTSDAVEPETIESAFTHEVKEESLTKSESVEHNKEQHQQGDYYKKIGEIIKQYDEVILFGPTNAKSELYNTLKEDHHFDKISIEVKSADKMTSHQQVAFVKNYFSPHTQEMA